MKKNKIFIKYFISFVILFGLISLYPIMRNKQEAISLTVIIIQLIVAVLGAFACTYLELRNKNKNSV